MKVKAILWDGFNKIQGELALGNHKISFHLSDFSNTNLEFDLPYSEIVRVKYHHIYNISEKALEIISKAGKSNVFVVSEPEGVKEKIENKIVNPSNL